MIDEGYLAFKGGNGSEHLVSGSVSQCPGRVYGPVLQVNYLILHHKVDNRPLLC